MNRSTLVVTAAVVLGSAFGLFLTGCGSDVTETGATTTSSTTSTTTYWTTSANSTGGGGSGGAPLASVTFSGTAVRSPQGTPLAGVEVCTFDHEDIPCTTSDSVGSFSLPVPANAETGVTLTKAGYAGILVPIVPSDIDPDGWMIGVPTLPSVQGFYEAAGAPYPDPGTGFLAVYATDGNTQQGFAGVSITVSPTPGVGPLYADETGAPDVTLQATSSSGLARFGSLALGEIDVALSAENASCESIFGGWPSTSANAVRVPIADGFDTRVGFGCL